MTLTTNRTATLGGRLRAARIFAGIEQSDMAAQLGCVRQSIWNWENDKNEISGPAMIRWAELTRVNLEWLGFGTVRPEGFEPPAYCSVADERFERILLWTIVSLLFLASAGTGCTSTALTIPRANASATGSSDLVLAA